MTAVHSAQLREADLLDKLNVPGQDSLTEDELQQIARRALDAASEFQERANGGIGFIWFYGFKMFHDIIIV